MAFHISDASGAYLETLPEPLDSRVELKKVPEHLMAALKYSGSWSKSRYEEKKKQLREWIEKKGLKQIGEPIFARYNSLSRYGSYAEMKS